MPVIFTWRCMFVVHSLHHVRLFATPWTAACQLPCPSSSPGTCSNSCQLIQWCHPTISSSVVPFSSCLQAFPASASFPVSQHFVSGGQIIEASASLPVPPKNIQNLFPLGLTGLILLHSKGLYLPLITAFTESHRFWVVMFSLFFSMHILISFFISSMICWLFRSMLFSLHMFVFFNSFFFCSWHIIL